MRFPTPEMACSNVFHVQRSDTWAARPAVLVALVIALTAAAISLPASARGSTHAEQLTVAGGSIGNTAPIYTNISYTASADGFPLSYGEMLPINYVPSKAYPLLVYFHGEGHSTGLVRGGSGDGLAGWNNSAFADSKTLIPLVHNASAYGYIIIAPSPRESEGFYTNSTCGGPEQQDTMDAIHLEESLRNVSGVYALGFSMGSLAALSLAGHEPGLFKAVAVTGTITDAFEEVAFKARPASGLVALDCGALPSAKNASVVRLMSYLSVLRFHPQNFSNIRLWMSAGGLDKGAPDNPTVWPFLQANDTMLTQSCLVAVKYAEPANCTRPIERLHTVTPTSYAWRFIYEPGAGHTLAQLEVVDMFVYFAAAEPGGCYTSTFPPTVNTVCK